MKIAPFAIEDYFALYEFTTPHSLCASDCESMTTGDLLRLAGTSAESLLDVRLGYTESQGHPELRAAISAQTETGTPDSIVILNSPEEGIYISLHALLEPGDHVVVLSPAYGSLINLAEHLTGNVSRWELQPGDGRWELDLNALETLVTAQTRLIIVNFPHNPTGYLPDRATQQAIIDIARRHGAWLFCDEMYRGLERKPADRLPSAADLYERAITLAGLSKVHGLPGLRAGWLDVRDEALRQEIITWKFYTSICPPAPTEFLALTALQAQDAIIGRNRALIHHNLALAEPFFARWPEMFDWRPPDAGPVALVGLGVPAATPYCHALAREEGVLLLPSSCLDYGDQHVRFGFGRADFAAALAAYERVLEERG